MRIKHFFTLLLGLAAFSASAQGYKDGVEYYKAGQFDNAITILQRNLGAADTDKAVAYYYLGASKLNLGDKTEAKKNFDLGIQANPECAYNYVGLGALSLLNGDLQTAQQNFKKAQSLAKKNNEITVDIARAYYNADPVKYDKEIEKMIAKAEKDSKFKEPSIYILKGDRKADAKSWGEAATEYEQAITYDPNNSEGYVKYANTYFNVVPQYAIDKLKQLLQNQPNSALAQRELAEKYYQNDQWSDAAKQYGKYIENPNHFPQDKARYAVLLFAGEQYDKSLQIANEVLAQENPHDVTLRRLVIRNLSELNRKDEALKDAHDFFANSETGSKANAADYRIYGQLLRDTKQDSLALVKFEEGLVKFPNDANLLKEVSDLYFDQRNYVPAAQNYALYIAALPNPTGRNYYDGALRFLGAASSQEDSAKRLELANEGIAMMDKALEGIVPPVQYLRRKALLYIIGNENKANDEAVAIWDQILQTLNQDPKNADPKNADNYLSYYVEAYKYKGQNAALKGDKEGSDAAAAQLEKYEALLAQAPQQ